jgi:hypothetical protein
MGQLSERDRRAASSPRLAETTEADVDRDTAAFDEALAALFA